jgi:hypothetical protein
MKFNFPILQIKYEFTYLLKHCEDSKYFWSLSLSLSCGTTFWFQFLSFEEKELLILCNSPNLDFGSLFHYFKMFLGFL